MTDSQLVNEIRDNLAVVLQRREGNLASAIARLDELRASARGHLAHYLAKRSYNKAWILLEGGDPEAGGCS